MRPELKVVFHALGGLVLGVFIGMKVNQKGPNSPPDAPNTDYLMPCERVGEEGSQLWRCDNDEAVCYKTPVSLSCWEKVAEDSYKGAVNDGAD